MNAVAKYEDGEVKVTEFRKLNVGDLVIVGRAEDGGDGIYFHNNCFMNE